MPGSGEASGHYYFYFEEVFFLPVEEDVVFFFAELEEAVVFFFAPEEDVEVFFLPDVDEEVFFLGLGFSSSSSAEVSRRLPMVPSKSEFPKRPPSKPEPCEDWDAGFFLPLPDEGFSSLVLTSDVITGSKRVRISVTLERSRPVFFATLPLAVFLSSPFAIKGRAAVITLVMSDFDAPVFLLTSEISDEESALSTFAKSIIFSFD